MYDVRTNVFENKMVVLFKGKIELPEAKMISSKIVREARKLSPGFSEVADIREFSLAAEDVRLEFQTMMKGLKEAGIGPVIHVVSPKNQIAANQLQRTSRAAGYQALEVSSLVEAERILDQL